MGYFVLLQHLSYTFRRYIRILDSDIGYFAILQQISGFADPIFGYFVVFGANEWIHRPDIRIFRDFATGTDTWYWYSIRAPDRSPDPYIIL